MGTDKEREYTLITNPRELALFVEQHANAEWIAFDTEFTKEFSYQTRLCLIQVSSPFGNYIIDCLEMDDVSTFTKLLADPSIRKITHSGSNDYQIFYDRFDTLPRNVFDTQIARSFISIQPNISLGRLIEEELGFALEKGLAVTNWEKRPLREEQLQYALHDVVFLKLIQDRMVKELEELGRTEWAENEMRKLELSGTYYRDIIGAVFNKKWSRLLPDEKKAFLIKMLYWREEEAKVRDRPSNSIMKIQHLQELVNYYPEKEDYLTDSRKFPYGMYKRFFGLFRKMYDSISPEDVSQALMVSPRVEAKYIDRSDSHFLIEFIKLYISYVCHKHNISTSLLATPREIKDIIENGKSTDSLFNEEWKSRLLGENFREWLSPDNRLEIDLVGSSFHVGLTPLEAPPVPDKGSQPEPKEVPTPSPLHELGLSSELLDGVPGEWTKATRLVKELLPEEHRLKQMQESELGEWVVHELRPVLEDNGIEFRKEPKKPWEMKRNPGGAVAPGPDPD